MTPEPEVFPLAQGPADLDQQILRQHQLIRESKARRPANTDLAALTVWAADHEVLTTRLEVLQGQRSTSWRPAPERPVVPPPPAQPIPPTPKGWRSMPFRIVPDTTPIPAAPEPAPEAPRAPEPEPAPTPEEPVKDLNLPPITPAQDRLAKAVATYNAKLAKVKADPSNRAFRQAAHKWASTARAIALHAKPRLPKPELEPLPALPDPKYGKKATPKAKPAPAPAPAVNVKVKVATKNLEEFKSVVEKAIPTHAREVAAQVAQDLQRSPCADDCTCHLHGGHLPATTADLDARDRTLSRRTAPEQFATPCDALETLRRIRRDTWLLLVQLADLPPAERVPYRAGLQAVIVGCESGLDLVDEADMAAGA